MRLDYHVHVLAHGEYQFIPERINAFLEYAEIRGLTEIGFSEHDEFASMVDPNLLQRIKEEKAKSIDIKLGLEVDFIHGREMEIREITSRQEYDYIIGSVHFIDGWGFDHPDSRQGFEDRDIDEVYKQYAQLVMEMVGSGLVDVVGHIDLIKIWGHRPRKRSTSQYMYPVLEMVKKSGAAVEINSAGLRKPVKEIYPAAELIKAMYERDIPITFGSDAHMPEQIGEGLEEAYVAAKKAGYRYMTRFQHRRQILAPFTF